MRMFEEWDCLQLIDQMWVVLCTMIQEVFQQCLNATAPTAGHHGYAPARPFQQNAFRALTEDTDNDEEESVIESVANQVAALTYQSQLTASTAATRTQRNKQQLAAIAANQAAMHSTLHQIIAQLNTVMFNASDVGCSICPLTGHGRGRATGREYGHGFHCGPPQYVGGPPQSGGFLHLSPPPGSGFQKGPARVPAYVHPSGPPPQNLQGSPRYHAPAVAHRQVNVQQLPYSNVVRRNPNWNVCYSCKFDVAKGHNSMSCPPQLRRASHDIYFNPKMLSSILT